MFTQTSFVFFGYFFASGPHSMCLSQRRLAEHFRRFFGKRFGEFGQMIHTCSEIDDTTPGSSARFERLGCTVASTRPTSPKSAIVEIDSLFLQRHSRHYKRWIPLGTEVSTSAGIANEHAVMLRFHIRFTGTAHNWLSSLYSSRWHLCAKP